MSLRGKQLLFLEKFGWLLPDRPFLKWKFRLNMGYRLNLKDPKTFNEKIQWLKLNDMKPWYTSMVDKYAVKSIIAEKLGPEYVIPTIGVWDRAEDIDFNSLPEQFVLKCTHDSGSTVICRDRNELDKQGMLKHLKKALRTKYYLPYRETAYKDVPPKVLAEPFLDDGSKGLTDYKFFCFNGEPKLLYVSSGMNEHDNASMLFLNMEWKPAPFRRLDYKAMSAVPERPQGFDEMVRLSRMLSEGLRFVRVDFYQIGNEVKFSEFTLYPCAGMLRFENYSQDLAMGEMIQL